MEIKNELKMVCEEFLSILHTNHKEEMAISQLVQALDKLAILYHKVNARADSRNYPQAPSSNHERTLALVRDRFPSLGFYNIAGDISDNIGVSPIHVGDGVDDIADIADDLIKILWLTENTSLENALFHFEFGYKSHWGIHLRQLQLYLHDLMW